MRSLQDIRIDVVRMGKEIRVDPAFEEKFKELNEFLKTKFGCPDFKLEDFELDKRWALPFRAALFTWRKSL